MSFWRGVINTSLTFFSFSPSLSLLMYLLKFQHIDDYGHTMLVSLGGFKKFVLAHVQINHSVFWKVPDIGFNVTIFDNSFIHLYFSFLGQSVIFNFFIYGSYFVNAINE